MGLFSSYIIIKTVMQKAKLIIFFVTALLISMPAQCFGRLVSGEVHDKHTKQAIAGVAIHSAGKSLATTNAKGQFEVVVDDTCSMLCATKQGYEQAKHKLKRGETVVNFKLQPLSRQLDDVVVTADRTNKLLSTSMGHVNLTQQEIKNIPTVFGEADVVKALQLQPGVSAGMESFAGMNVRGGNNDENLFMLDGNPVYQLSHFGGLFSSFNVETISHMNFYKSAFPARYGGRVSSVIDLHTKPCDFQKYTGSAMLGLISGSFNITGPITTDKTAFSFSIRRSWLDLLAVPALAIHNIKQKPDGKKRLPDIRLST